MEKTQLVEQMKVVLATAFSLYLKAQNYHWNVTGANFAQYHDFFGKFYESVHGSVDDYAERIRILGEVAPGSIRRYMELTKISDELAVPSPKFMFVRLSSDNAILLNELRVARDMADALVEHGLVNHLEGQIDVHEKWQWMLDSFE